MSDSLSYFSLVCLHVQSIIILKKQLDLQIFALFQYRYATNWDLLVIFIGIVFTCIKTLVFPAFVAIYGEFTTLLVDRTLGTGTSTSTTILPIFGGGQIL